MAFLIRVWKIWCPSCKNVPRYNPSKMESDTILWHGCSLCGGNLERERISVEANGRGVSKALERAAKESMGLLR